MKAIEGNAPTVNRQERRRLHTRAKLMRASVELILKKGFDDIGVRDITDRADLGRGTFYIHFKNKEDVVWSAIKEGLDSAHRRGMEPLAGGSRPRRLELYVFTNFFKLAEKNRDLYRIILGSRGSATLSARALDYLVVDLLTEEDGISLSPTAGVPKTVWAQIVAGAIFRLMAWWLEASQDYTAEQIAGMLYKTLYGKT
jgi:AcrR family transcriptional regulator